MREFTVCRIMTLKCPKCNRLFKTQAALKQHEIDSHSAVSAQKKKKNTGSPRALAVAPAKATVVIAQEEYLSEVAVAADGKAVIKPFKMLPGVSGLTRLDQFGALFEQWRLDKWIVKVRPKVGTTIGGSYIVGVFYESKLTPTTKQEVSVLSPKIMGAVWQPGTLSVPPSLAQKQKWLYTHGSGVDEADSVAGQIVVAVDGSTESKVDLWVSYEITFMGPTSHKRVSDRTYRLDGQTWKDDTGRVVQTIDPDEGPYTADFEIGDSRYVDRIVDGFRSAFRQWQELQRVVSNGVTYVHGVLSAIDAAQAVQVGAQVGAIVALQRRPFRPALPQSGSGSGSVGLPGEASRGFEGGPAVDGFVVVAEARVVKD